MPVADLQNSADLETNLNQLLELARGHRTVWGTPVPWQAEPVFAKGFVVAPDFGAANRVITVTLEVPRGYTMLLCGLVFGFAGSATALPGQVLYTVDVNNPTAAAGLVQSGYTEKDFNSVPFQLGAFVGGPVWPVELRYDQNEVIRVKAQTVSGVPTGAGNFVFGALVGWQWPSMGWEG